MRQPTTHTPSRPATTSTACSHGRPCKVHTDTATITVTVTGTNQAPVAGAIADQSDNDADVISLDVSGSFSDVDTGDTKTVTQAEAGSTAAPGTTVFLSTPDTATWVGIHDLTARNILVGDGTAATMDRLLRDRTGTIIAVTRYDTPEVQDYLRARADYGAEFTAGEFTATLFGRPDRALTPLDLAATWDDVTIDGGRGLATVAPGALLPLELDVRGQVDGTRKFSFRLVAPDGAVVAQRDEVVQPTVRTALFVPPTAAPGTYTLAAVLYDPADLTPIPDVAGETEPALGEIAVE